MTQWTETARRTLDEYCARSRTVLAGTGAVVSRVTLWINGEERETAFGGRAQVREA